jgi:hypothetical protein
MCEQPSVSGKDAMAMRLPSLLPRPRQLLRNARKPGYAADATSDQGYRGVARNAIWRAVAGYESLYRARAAKAYGSIRTVSVAASPGPDSLSSLKSMLRSKKPLCAESVRFFAGFANLFAWLRRTLQASAFAEFAWTASRKPCRTAGAGGQQSFGHFGRASTTSTSTSIPSPASPAI